MAAKAASVSIVADVQERRSGVPAALEALGVEVEIASLPAGDYAIGADTIVERKEVLDLHSAIAKKHAVRGARLAAIDEGIALLRSDDRDDTARWLHRLAVRCQRVELPAERPLGGKLPRLPADSTSAEALLAAVPGISSASARALLGQFGTAAGVLAAEPSEWLVVPGIGARPRQGARAYAAGQVRARLAGPSAKSSSAKRSIVGRSVSLARHSAGIAASP